MLLLQVDKLMNTNFKILWEATHPARIPCAVYLLDEIWELVHTSPPEISSGFVDLAIRRLNNRSPIVKQKVRAHADK